jgi:hypothetical protein
MRSGASAVEDAGYPDPMDDLWARSRTGSHAGRGFRYQDAVAAEFAMRAWRGELALVRLIPEGLEDLSLDLQVHPLHLQAKSRREHRGDFREADLADAWRHLAERLVADPASHVGLVLERPLGVEGGLETGLERTLAEVATPAVRRSIARAVASVVDGDRFLARAHVWVIPATQTTAVDMLAERLGIAPASCIAHYAILRARLGELADLNGVRAADDPAALTVADVARLLEEVTAAVDPSALDEAVRSGACALVDFETAIDDARFYSGVDVVAGHVVAGLPLPRRELTAALRGGLDERRFALAVGPSGAGKSALIWLTAHATRHRVRWYRVSRLTADDVAPLVRLVRGLEPSGALVGFVVDDLGRDDRAGIDALIDELRAQPTAIVLGACREEDLFLVRAAPAAAQVRPQLEPELAERIWRELRDSGATDWAQWREPYARSEGLLLEYGHLLTEGQRIEETIAAQITRRVGERRAVELEVLALVATADAYGADLELEAVRAAAAVETVELRAALERLVDEHLISEHDGRLGGLHELRSRYIVAELHRLPPPTLADSVGRVIELLEPALLQRFIMRVLLERAVSDDELRAALAERFNRDADTRALAAALQALRLVGFRRTADKWRSVFDEEQTAPTNVELIAYFAISGNAEHNIFPEPMQRTIARVRALDYIDLRPPLLEQIDGIAARALAEATDVETAAAALVALSGVATGLDIDVAGLAALAADRSLADVRLLLEAAEAADPALAPPLAEALGGSAALLARLSTERPWLRNVRLDSDDDGHAIAAADYAHVAETHQPDPHEAVVDLARYLAALAPAAEVVICRAVDATGDAAGLGVPLADKRIERGNLPTRAEVAWNRARGRAALAALAADSETEHALAARDVVVGAARVVRRAGDAWARGGPPSQQLVEEVKLLAAAAEYLRPPPPTIDVAGPLDEGDSTLLDPASFIGSMICSNLLIRMFSGGEVGPLIPTMFKQLDELADPARWRWLDDPPLADVAALRQALVDIFAVAGERAHGDRISAVALDKAGKSGLAAAAKAARRRAEARMQARVTKLARVLAHAGYRARVLRRDTEPESHRWPSDDFLVLVDVPSIFAWQREGDALAELCRPLLQDRVVSYMAPVRDGKVVASFAVKIIQDAFPTELGDWPELPTLADETLYRECATGLAALGEVSGVMASVHADEVHDDEGAVVEAASRRAQETLRYLEGVLDQTDDPLIKEIAVAFLDFAHAVEAEAAALAAGEPVDRGFAASLIHGLKGDRDDVFFTYVGLLSCCIEWDIDRAAAWSLCQDARSEAPTP